MNEAINTCNKKSIIIGLIDTMASNSHQALENAINIVNQILEQEHSDSKVTLSSSYTLQGIEDEINRAFDKIADKKKVELIDTFHKKFFEAYNPNQNKQSNN